MNAFCHEIWHRVTRRLRLAIFQMVKWERMEINWKLLIHSNCKRLSFKIRYNIYVGLNLQFPIEQEVGNANHKRQTEQQMTLLLNAFNVGTFILWELLNFVCVKEDLLEISFSVLDSCSAQFAYASDCES